MKDTKEQVSGACVFTGQDLNRLAITLEAHAKQHGIDIIKMFFMMKQISADIQRDLNLNVESEQWIDVGVDPEKNGELC